MNRFFRIICALVGLGTASCGQKAYVELSAKQFGQLIQSTPNIQLVDVRTEEEYRKSRLEHAVLIDINKPEFKQQAERTLRKDHPVAVYCRRGRRSAKAAAILAKAGYQVTSLKGGIEAWQRNEMPVITPKKEQ
ncbi:MAG: rhodanese-like domain-containing protein [Bacteroidaceae bacterium]|jgi:rhodanese-related sulfurtransferase|nr:rhodanese-like domain-containing protein [Bacteroidaceae bacterium]